ncbi:MAG: HlyD family secretion protein [Chitinophagales bacterium]|nr:HlyD family secretion protein [Chitinophagales bacterium]
MAESLQQSLYTVEIALSNLSSQLYDNQYALSTKSNEELMSYQNVRNALLAKIAWWKQQYLIVSPINGSISFINNLYENQFVNANEPIVSVIPPQNEMLAMVQVPLEGAGKIGKGQKVRFNLTNYPAAEFGYINGEIKSLSLIPNKDNFYYAEVILPNGLYTSSKKELNFTPNLQASAEIITQKERLINKIFIRFKELKDKIS